MKFLKCRQLAMRMWCDLQTSGSGANRTEAEILVMENVTYEDAGWYTCLAGNSMGISHSSAWLTVVPSMCSLTK